MVQFIKTETINDITYTGVNDMVGASYFVKKEHVNLDIRIIIPITLGKQTWEQFIVQLDRLT